MSNSDYNKKRTNLNDYLPEVVKSKFIRTVNENLFNRYLTKVEYTYVDGLIGKPDNLADDNNQIQERTAFNQKFQLQPVVYDKVGTVDWFLTFNDFLTRLSRLGVDVDKFNEWGNALQFNWVPPVDFDKLINYQDYYWESQNFDDNPQYITIKNQCTWTSSRLDQIKKSAARILPNIKILHIDDTTSTISVGGNLASIFSVDQVLISYNGNNVYNLYTIQSIAYNNSTLRTDIVVVESVDVTMTNLVNTYLIIVAKDITTNTLTVNGDVSSLFTDGYVFSTVDSPTQVTTFWEVLSSSFNSISNTTNVVTKENIENTFNWLRISTTPALSLAVAENSVVCDNASANFIPVWNDNDIGTLLWYSDYNIVNERNTGITTFGTNIFTDTSIDFNSLSTSIKVNDILQITYETGQVSNYNIVTVTSDHTLLVTSNVHFFARTGVTYKIIRNVPYSSLQSDNTPVSPTVNDYWVDTVNDQLKQWDGTSWIVLADAISLIYNTTNGLPSIKLVQHNDWASQNRWIHRNELTNFTGKIRAQLPIIEYFPYLEMSNISYAVQKWQYRATPSDDYVEISNIPELFELLDIKFATIANPEFSFQSSKVIVLNEKYGNLTSSLTPGTKIVLDNFIENDGIYEVAKSEYLQLAANARFVTRIYLVSDVVNILDVVGGATITPLLTSMGDPFLGVIDAQWLFDGIDNITSSSMQPVKNPMLDVAVSSYIDNTQNLNCVVGLVWEEVSFTVPSRTIIFDPSLHDLALYQDYQEGDVRVYVNGNRQYGNYTDIRSTINEDYIGGIRFASTVNFTTDDVIRIELGEYALSDIGKRAVNVITPAGNDLYNLVTFRKIEQVKTELNQYPYFNVYNIFGNPYTFASILFGYKEDQSNVINLNVFKRIAYDPATRDCTFVQYLTGDNEELYLYKDFSELSYPLQSIWKKGTFNEQYVPQRLDATTWDLPNQWYYNISHENKKEVSLTQLYRHINTIIAAQKVPSVFSVNSGSLFYLDDNIDYGLGGTIKEHNDGFDLLVSTVFENNVNPISLIQFAHDQYSSNIKAIQEKLQINAANLLAYNVNINNVSQLTAYISEYIKDWFETNEKYDEWFGDSTTYNELTNVGIRNWIATIPYMYLGAKYQPYVIHDGVLDITEVYHHDGHRSSQSYNMSIKEQIYQQLKKVTTVFEQYVTNNVATPAITPVPGNYLIVNNLTEKTRKLYRYSAAFIWEELNLDVLLANTILKFEQGLYNNLPPSSEVDTFVSKYDFDSVLNNARYNSLIKLQYSSYLKNNNISGAYSNTNIYKPNDSYTWNYAYTPVPTHPVTGNTFTNVAASWEALYSNVYGTPYPHLEPWVLQGYVNKPLWWDTTYRDNTNVRVWKQLMWNNIFNGVIPVGNLTPTGTAGTGLINQLSNLYNFLSVNTDSTPTNDGVLPDGLLPPYWNTINTSNPRIRSLYDPKLQQFINSPQANYVFGQDNLYEWEWNVSSQRLYDNLIVAFKIDPMRFIHRTYGLNFTNVNCLQVDTDLQRVFSHTDTVFHGDFIGNTNKVFLSNGLNQWYTHFNRYNNYDDVSSGFKSLWKNWETKLSYLFSSYIDTPSFLIYSDIFDITTKDYKIDVKKTYGVDDKWIDAIKGTVLNVPSQYIVNRNHSAEWNVEFDNTSPIGRDLLYFAPENYDFRMISDTTARIYSYELDNAGIENVYGYQIVGYNQTIVPSTVTQLSNTSFLYWFILSIDGAVDESFSIQGNQAQTFADLVSVLNIKFNNRATAFIQNGNLVIKSNTFGGASNITLNPANLGLFQSADNNYSGISNSLQTDIKFLNYFVVKGNKTNVFPASSELVISDSTNFNGTYNIISSVYDIATQNTILTVSQNVTLSNLIVDGIIEPAAAKTFPIEWVSGTEVYLNTTGVLPTKYNDTTPFYVILVNNREFKLADTAAKAKSGIAIISDMATGAGAFYVGRLQTTFTAADVDWRQHYSDKRYIERMSPPLSLSGIQYMVDFFKGYQDYCEFIGFSSKSVDGENVDPDTGRINTWLFEVQKFIDSLYHIRSLKTAISPQYEITANSAINNFSFNHGYKVNWGVGTQVVLSAGVNSQLPVEFNNPLIAFIPYYVIPTIDQNKFQLATSLYNAKNGIAIDLTDNGFGELYATLYQANKKNPVLEVNPFKNYIWVNNTLGVLANIFDGSSVDILTNQRVYDNSGNQMTVKELITLREDKESRISLTLQQQETNLTANSPIYMSGMHLFFDGYENILTFENYSTDGTLIYDSFLGLNTPRFFLSFNRQDDYTLRPNVGGFVLFNNDLIQNFESSIDNLRNLYDPYNESEGVKTTDMVRKSLGYDGPKDYMTSLKINPKSQFIFWRGMIQKKGTNFAANAFINQKTFQNLEIYEFWAYKLATFGDTKQQIYPQLKLYTSDVSKKELCLRFVNPDDTTVDTNFKNIKLTDMERWLNQPDVFAQMSPSQAFYFDTDVIRTITNAENVVTAINGRNVIELDVIASAVIGHFDIAIVSVDPANKTITVAGDVTELFAENDVINVLDPTGGTPTQYVFTIDTITFTTQTVIVVNEDIPSTVSFTDIINTPIYYPDSIQLLNSTIIEFDAFINLLKNVTLYIFSYAYDAENPSKILDKQSNVVVSNVPIWHPAIGQYYYNAIGVVDIKTATDPAAYTDSLDDVFNNYWAENNIGKVWADDSIEGYYPYYDSAIYPNLNDGLSKWGVFADWADIKLYEWTQSDVLPSAWDALASAPPTTDTNQKTGQVYKKLYKNVGTLTTPVWELEEDIHENYIAGVITSSNTTSLSGVVEVYVNGKYKENIILQTILPSASPTITPSPTPTLSVTNTPTHTPTLSPTRTSSATPIVSPTISLTPSVGTSVTPTPTISSSVTPTITITPTNTITITPTITPTHTVTSTTTPTITITPTITPTLTATNTITPTITTTPTITPSITASVSPTIGVSTTAALTPTISPTVTISTTPSSTPSATPSITPSNTPASNINFVVYAATFLPETYLHIVKRAHVPTQDELDSNQYKYDTPYTVVSMIDKNSTAIINTYYFWVTNKTSKTLSPNGITIYQAEKILKNMSYPYLVIPSAGYKNPDVSNALPTRFNIAVVKGLAGLVQAENRYTLEFTRDFTLRDHLPNDKQLNDVHVEWKLIREKQLSKIDEYLWTKLVEALILQSITDRVINVNSQLPSLNRVLYDSLYNADTKYGLGDGQVFTDSTISLQTILTILRAPNANFGSIDITAFLTAHSFNTPVDITNAMYEIYDTFPIDSINYIYFQTLYDALSLKLEYSEFIKTSWVAIQVNQNVVTPKNADVNSYVLEPGGECFLGNVDQPIDYIPIVEYSAYITSDGTLTYISYSGNEYTLIIEQQLNRISGIGVVSGMWSDGTYFYVTSASGGVDIYYFNGTNFVLSSNLTIAGNITSVYGYNPILITSYNATGLDIYAFNGAAMTKVTDGSAITTNVRHSTVHNGYIITCGFGRLDAWQYVAGVLNHIDTFNALLGGTDIVSVVSDGTYIYTGSNNSVKLQVFTFDGSNIAQVYADPTVNSGPSIAVGNGYFFTNGTDIRAYEYDSNQLVLISSAGLGPNYSNILYSEESQRLYAANVGIYNFSNNVFEKLYDHVITPEGTTVASQLVGINQINPPQLSPTPTPTVTATPTLTRTPTPTHTRTATITPSVTPVVVSSTPTPTPTNTVTPTLTASATQTVTPTSTLGTSVTPTVTPTITSTPQVTNTNTPTITATPTMTSTPTSTATITPTVTRSVTPSPTRTITPSPSNSSYPIAWSNAGGNMNSLVFDPNTSSAVPSSGVIFGGSVFIAWYTYDNLDGTFTSVIASSTNGINWTQRYSNANLLIINIVRGTSEFVGVATTSISGQTTALVSSAGTSWSTNLASATRVASSLHYNPSYGYVATTATNFSGGSVPMFTSTNGTSWSTASITGAYGGNYIADMVSDNSSTYIARLVGSNNNEIAYGTGNPPSVTFISGVQNWTWNSTGGMFAYINALFFITVINDVGVSAGTYVASTPTSWTLISANKYDTWVYGASKYYLSDGTTSIYSTDGGVTWLNGINSAANGQIAYNGTVCVCTNGNIGFFV